MAGVLFYPEFAGKTAQAAFANPPLPTYSEVNSIEDITTVSVPANLVTEWRGIFTLPVGSKIARANDLRSYIQSVIEPGQKSAKRTYKYSPRAVYAWTQSIATSVNVPTSEPFLKIEDGRAIEFTPPQTGKALDRYNSTLKIIEALQNSITTIDLVVATTQPTKKLGDSNNLGITELIGRGESKFNGSPRNRRHNIKVGVSKMQGVIVEPGDEFSFNKYLGPVEASTGFLPELVIKKTGTVPEFGGGLCQVSSTTFRAAMHAGLPITQRRNHSYAVQYYAPQGTDATIYPGVIDLKFKNDTGHSILIWPYFKDENYLIFDFYGTFDGRKVTLDKPISYDRQSSGAMKAYWTRTVISKDGVTKNDRFDSVYQSPALFHKQEEFPTAPAPGTQLPEPSPTPSGEPTTSPTPNISPTPKPTQANNN